MAQGFTKAVLSGSTHGKGIKVTGTGTGSSVTVHQVVNSTSDMDEVWIYAYNGHTANVTLTLEWGETTVPDGNIIVDIPFKQGRFLVVDGRLLRNNLSITAFASVANVIVLDGFVNQIRA